MSDFNIPPLPGQLISPNQEHTTQPGTHHTKANFAKEDRGQSQKRATCNRSQDRTRQARRIAQCA